MVQGTGVVGPVVGVFVALLLCVSTATYPTGVITIATEWLSVSFDGINPRITLYPGNSTDIYYTIAFAALQELDASEGTVPQHKVPELSAENFQFSPVSKIPLNDSFVLNLNMTTTITLLGKQVPMEIDSYLYSDPIDYDYGNDILGIPHDSLRIALKMDSWPFDNMNNSLRLYVQVFSSSQDDEVFVKRNVTGEESVGIKGAATNVMSTHFPEHVMIDGYLKPKNTSVEVDLNDKMWLMMLFPHFDTLEFQFVVHLEDMVPNDTVAKLSQIDIILICVSGGCAVIISSMVIIYIWKRQSKNYLTIY